MPLTWDELTRDSAWPDIAPDLEAAPSIRVMDPDPQARRVELERWQITTASALGAVVAHTAAIQVDHGWLTLHGSGGRPGSWSISEATRLLQLGHSDLVVGWDVLGGVFALNGGGLGTDIGSIYHWPPEVLAWESLDGGYGTFLQWIVDGNYHELYDHLRWEGWRDDTKALPGGHGFLSWPPLSSREGSDPEKIRRRPVPIVEALTLPL